MVGFAIVIVVARKWDSFKWIFALVLVGLALFTAFQMGLFDKQLDKIPEVEFTNKP